MNREALKALAQNAAAWAEAYTRVKEELVKRGVREEEAREAATRAANLAALEPEDESEQEPWG